MRTERIARQQAYEELVGVIDSVLEVETSPIVWMSTLACLIKEATGFLWVGFYLNDGDGLSVGPYQGKLGCLHIPKGRGVCGACALRREAIIVPEVRKFPGHIACDEASRSEIVVPIFDQRGRVRAVLDIDSSEPEDFGELDKTFLERISAKMRMLAWDRTT